MATVSIPIPTFSIRPFTEQVELDGSTYDLSFTYNARDGKWRLTIELAGTVLVRNLPLVADADVLRNFDHVEDLPPGTILVHDLDGLDTDPNDTNFGDRVLLLYTEAA